ncbi:SDR family NAD(P)-dependent oxidoreductase [Hymenobacter sp.]|uniref:SDR family oxidoreductase n=1 Tax=Hymenobacter sp. TaxID=1898978 RepID=UPI00286B4FE2|nr:SDR family NAD(P)-dependent oxidoreductase [Hymenobacter sp.]
MQIANNTILITGGATGIGLALAEALLQAGNDVLICGRRADKLREAQLRLPQLRVRVCDVAVAADRAALCAWALAEAPRLNVLINNAGVQREIDFARHPEALAGGASEIAINLEAPLHLTALLLPHLRQQPAAAIVNVSSGLAFVPLTRAPVYSATKAALHSFSISLRHQLRDTPVRVFEIIPPIVDTDLDQGARAQRGQTARGLTPAQVATATLDALRRDTYEAPVGLARVLRLGSRFAPGRFLKIINRITKS